MLTEDQAQRVAEAVDAAEHGSHGEIRVVVEPDPGVDPDEAALRLWRELDLDDDGVLLLAAVGRRQVRVLAGPRLLAETDEAFWQAAADAVAGGFRAGDPVDGLRRALGPIGELLRRVAPASG
jgi:uncharacterized membrane protein